jgi:hypothetical protein
LARVSGMQADRQADRQESRQEQAGSHRLHRPPAWQRDHRVLGAPLAGRLHTPGYTCAAVSVQRSGGKQSAAGSRQRARGGSWRVRNEEWRAEEIVDPGCSTDGGARVSCLRRLGDFLTPKLPFVPFFFLPAGAQNCAARGKEGADGIWGCCQRHATSHRAGPGIACELRRCVQGRCQPQSATRFAAQTRRPLPSVAQGSPRGVGPVDVAFDGVGMIAKGAESVDGASLLMSLKMGSRRGHRTGQLGERASPRGEPTSSASARGSSIFVK